MNAAVQRLPYQGDRHGHAFDVRDAARYSAAIELNGRWSAQAPRGERDGSGGIATRWWLGNDSDGAFWNLGRRIQDVALAVAEEPWAAVLDARTPADGQRFAARMRSRLRALRPDARRANQPGRDQSGRAYVERSLSDVLPADRNMAERALGAIELRAGVAVLSPHENSAQLEVDEEANPAQTPSPVLLLELAALRAGFIGELTGYWLSLDAAEDESPPWATWACLVLATIGMHRGAIVRNSVDLEALLHGSRDGEWPGIAARMHEPEPGKSGVRPTRTSEALELQLRAEALVGKLFRLLRAPRSENKAPEDKRDARAREAVTTRLLAGKPEPGSQLSPHPSRGRAYAARTYSEK